MLGLGQQSRPGAIGKADVVSLVHVVEVPRRPVSRLEPVIGTLIG